MSDHDDELEPPWRAWADARPPARVDHLDTAAAGRSSTAVLAAMAGHTVAEATTGAYVAAASAQSEIEAGRATLAELLGMQPAGLAFVESATAALTAMLAAWPFRDGDVVAVVPSEWGPNLAAFAHRHLVIRELRVEGDGAVDMAGLEAMLRDDPPGIVHLTQVASHRSLVQPVAAVAERCATAGVPLWVDAAQALGHVDTAAGGDVVYATGRKWLAGPRGVGVLGVAERHWPNLRLVARTMEPIDTPPVRYLESHEANIAGRVGLAVAVAEHAGVGPGAVRRRLQEIGRATRTVLADLPGWEIVGAVDDHSAITALRPTAGQDVFAVREHLLTHHSILTTACGPARAPREMTGPLLRVSPHVDAAFSALLRLRDALVTLGGGGRDRRSASR